MVGALSEREALGSRCSCEVKASEQIGRFRPFDPDQLFPSRGSTRHHYGAPLRENCSTMHRKCLRFQAGAPVKYLRSAENSDRSRCRSGHPDSSPMPHIFCSCSALMHESKDAATWIGRRGSGDREPLRGISHPRAWIYSRRRYKASCGGLSKGFSKRRGLHDESIQKGHHVSGK